MYLIIYIYRLLLNDEQLGERKINVYAYTGIVMCMQIFIQIPIGSNIDDFLRIVIGSNNSDFFSHFFN